MEIVAGLNLNNLKPKVYDSSSEYFLPELRAVMVSYAEFDKSPGRRRKAMEQGLRDYLNVADGIKIYLDNGSFSFIKRNKEVPRKEYEEFVEKAAPNWYAIPQDYIPTPKMSDEVQLDCLNKTMQVNLKYSHDGYVPVVHISRQLTEYLNQLKANEKLRRKEGIALGGIVPNLLRMPKAMNPVLVLENVRQVRQEFKDKRLHIFGVGGIATLHLTALLGVDSVDSSGWRNRAARGIIQLPGRGERIAANLGSWRGKELNADELIMLENCSCPACKTYGITGLRANKSFGFQNRATHNLWTLLDEVRQLDEHLTAKTYADWYLSHVQNSTYLPLIQQAVEWFCG